MKTFLSLAVGVFLLIGFVSSADAAIKIETAMVENGVAFIQGNGAVRGAQIFWEGSAVATANKNNGGFSFFGVLPNDCVGALSDQPGGATPVNVQVLDCTPVSAASAPVPRTGQTTCYDAIGTTIPCAGTGQDGEVQAGVPLPTPRFTDNNNGTITDNLTGLIWLKNANCIGTLNPGFDQDFAAGDGYVTWQHALDFVAGINAGTYNCGDTSNGGTHQTDWRLPNIREIQASLYIYDKVPSYPGSPFTNFGVGYWSSTSRIDIPSDAWGVLYDQSFVV